MKKYQILLLLVAVILSVGCKKNGTKQQTYPITSAAKKTSLQEEGLLGNVQETVDAKFVLRMFPDGRDTLILHSIKTQTYNRAGMIESAVIITAEGDTAYRMQSTYNEQNKLIRSDSYDSDGQLVSYVIYTNDKNGFRTKAEYFEHDSLTYFEEHTNDAKGNVTVTKVSDGVASYYIRFTNNNNGLPVKVEWFNEGVAQSAYQTQILEYDARGNVINRQVSIQNRSVEYYHAQYDENGHLLKDVYQSSMPNHLTEVVAKYGVLDSHGNWTHQETYTDQQKDYLIERTIKYY